MDPRLLADEELVDDLIVFARYLHPEAGLLKKGPCKYKVHNRCVRLVVKQEDGCLPELFVADGPLEQPLADYVRDSGRRETWSENPACQTALHSIPPEARISFEEVYPETRWEAMGVAVQEAEAREQHAQHVKSSPAPTPPAPPSAAPSPRLMPPTLLSSSMLAQNPLAQSFSQGLLPPAKLPGSFMPPPVPARSLSRGSPGSQAPGAPRAEVVGLPGEGSGMLMRSVTPSPSRRSNTPPPVVAAGMASPSSAYRTTFSPGPTARSVTPSRLVSASTASPGVSYRNNAASPGPTYRSGIASPAPAVPVVSSSPGTGLSNSRTRTSPTPGAPMTPMTPSTPSMPMRSINSHSQQLPGTARDGRSLSPALDARAVDAAQIDVPGMAPPVLAANSFDVRSKLYPPACGESFDVRSACFPPARGDSILDGRRPPARNSHMMFDRDCSRERSDSVPPLLKRNCSESVDMAAASGIGQTARLERQNSKTSTPTLADFHRQSQPAEFAPILQPTLVPATSHASQRMRQTSMPVGLQYMPPTLQHDHQSNGSGHISRSSNAAVIRLPSPVLVGSYRSGNTYDSFADTSVDTRRSRGASLPRASSPEGFSTNGRMSIFQTPEKAKAADVTSAGPGTGTTNTPTGTPISRSRGTVGLDSVLNSPPVMRPRACTPGSSARLSLSPARTPLVELRQVRPGNPDLKMQFMPISRDQRQEAVQNHNGLGYAVPAMGSNSGLCGTPRQAAPRAPIPLVVAPPANHATAVLNSAPFVCPAPSNALLELSGRASSMVPLPAWDQHGAYSFPAGHLRSSGYCLGGAGGVGMIASRNQSRGRSPGSHRPLRQ